MNKEIIAFDVPHIADFNMLKNSILILAQRERFEIVVYTLNRGLLYKIVRAELPTEVSVIKLGQWKRNIFLKLFVTNFFRSIQFFIEFIKSRPSIGVSPGSLPFSLALFLMRIKSLQFSDDVERWFLNSLESLFATEKYFPKVTKNFSNKRIRKIAMLKQWAFLSPKYFVPTPEILEAFGLEERKYFFVREILTGSTNYKGQMEYLISKIADKFPNDYRVVLSLEDKSVFNNYPRGWILLNEPIDHFHSLIYYCKALISSGDSMAREAGVLGVPSIYCGFRRMESNVILEQKGILLQVPYLQVPDILEKITKNKIVFEDQETFRKQLSLDFIELTDYIVERTVLNLK